jgi:hypothetical protein
VCGAINSSIFTVSIVLKSGSLNLLETQDFVQSCINIAPDSSSLSFSPLEQCMNVSSLSYLPQTPPHFIALNLNNLMVSDKEFILLLLLPPFARIYSLQRIL